MRIVVEASDVLSVGGKGCRGGKQFLTQKAAQMLLNSVKAGSQFWFRFDTITPFLV